MRCPDCASEVTGEISFCFTCLRHVPAETLVADVGPSGTQTVAEEKPVTRSRSWEPGILGTVQAFGRAAASSAWRRTRTESPS
jgi:hypothetical protein